MRQLAESTPAKEAKAFWSQQAHRTRTRYEGVVFGELWEAPSAPIHRVDAAGLADATVRPLSQRSLEGRRRDLRPAISAPWSNVHSVESSSGFESRPASSTRWRNIFSFPMTAVFS